jgi:hypothetical protein
VSHIRVAAAVTALAAILAACGSSGTSGQTQFVNRVDGICLRALSTLGPSPKSIKNLPLFGHEVAKNLTIFVSQLQRLQAVKVPSQDSAEYSAVLRGLSKENELLRELIPPLLANNLQDVRKISASVAPTSLAIYRLEGKLGLLVCQRSV